MPLKTNRNKNDMNKRILQQLTDSLIDNNYYDLYDALADNDLETQELFKELKNTKDLEKTMRILRREVVSHITT